MAFFRKKEQKEEQNLAQNDETAERLLLTREDVLERLRECWVETDLRNGPLTEEGKELINLNLTIARIWTEVQESGDVTETVNVCGFHYEDGDDEDGADEYSEGDFPDEDERVYCKKD